MMMSNASPGTAPGKTVGFRRQRKATYFRQGRSQDRRHAEGAAAGGDSALCTAIGMTLANISFFNHLLAVKSAQLRAGTDLAAQGLRETPAGPQTGLENGSDHASPTSFAHTGLVTNISERLQQVCCTLGSS